MYGQGETTQGQGSASPPVQLKDPTNNMPRSVGEIEAALKQLDLEINMLDEVVRICEHRFDPVCRPVGPIGEPVASKTQAAGPLSLMLTALTRRVSEQRVRLAYLIERCEL